jgi:hypothetical protein
MNDGPFLADLTLGIFADVVDDMESVRSANENRLRSLTDVHGMNPQSRPRWRSWPGWSTR